MSEAAGDRAEGGEGRKEVDKERKKMIRSDIPVDSVGAVAADVVVLSCLLLYGLDNELDLEMPVTGERNEEESGQGLIEVATSVLGRYRAEESHSYFDNLTTL